MKRLLLTIIILAICAPAHALSVGDTVSRSGWLATCTVATQRTASSYLIQVTLAYAGVPTIVETRDLAGKPTNAAVLVAVNAEIDELEATRLSYVWAAANLPGQSKTVAGWKANCDAVGYDLGRRAIVLTITVSKGAATRTFQYDLRGRTQTLAAVGQELTQYITEKVAAITAAQAAVSDSDALARTDQ